MELKILRKRLSDGSCVYDLLIQGVTREDEPSEIFVGCRCQDDAWELAHRIQRAINEFSVITVTSIEEVAT